MRDFPKPLPGFAEEGSSAVCTLEGGSVGSEYEGDSSDEEFDEETDPDDSQGWQDDDFTENMMKYFLGGLEPPIVSCLCLMDGVHDLLKRTFRITKPEKRSSEALDRSLSSFKPTLHHIQEH